MKRRIAVSVFAALMVLTITGGTVFADLPGGGWVTNTQVQNTGGAKSQVQVVSYGAGGPYNSVIKEPDPGSSVTFLNTDLGIPPGFEGAGVILANEPSVAILFVTNYGTGAGNTGSAIVRGIGEENTSTDLSFPLAKKRWGGQKKTTTFYIQNAGTKATDVTATFLKLSGAGTCTPGSKTYADVAMSEQINFTPQDLGCPDGVYGSLTVSSGPTGEPLAGIVLEHDDDLTAPAGGTKVLSGTTGFSPADYDTKLIAPIIKKGYGANKNVTGLQVQNVGPDEIPIGDLKVTYYITRGPDAGTTKEEFNTSVVPIGGAFNSLHAILSNGTLASAVIEVLQPDTQRIVGIVNENRPPGAVYRNTTYSMLPAKNAATSVSLPLVKEFYGGSGGRCTGVQVFAVGGTAKMQLNYKSATVSQTVTTDNEETSKTFVYVSNGGTGVTYSGTPADMRGKNFGVTATSLTSGVKLVAIANESFCPGSTRDEDDANYEGFALP
jgi:hypothetical protein